jgi:hypothetical protein
MILYLASFLEPENFGKGRVIGIAAGNKPVSVNVDTKFLPFIPLESITKEYYIQSTKDQIKASRDFITSFRKQLDDFYSLVLEKADERGVSPMEVLPFSDGDTLASWERAGRSNYRNLVGEILKKFGYSVVVN